jgi:hypothetical protein
MFVPALPPMPSGPVSGSLVPFVPIVVDADAPQPSLLPATVFTSGADAVQTPATPSSAFSVVRSTRRARRLRREPPGVPVPASIRHSADRDHLRRRELNEPPVVLVMTRADDDEPLLYDLPPPRLVQFSTQVHVSFS